LVQAILPIGWKYSLSVPPGTYDVTASKLPEYDGNTTFNIEVNAETTSYANMSLSLKPTGTINGTVVTVDLILDIPGEREIFASKNARILSFNIRSFLFITYSKIFQILV